MEKLKDCMSAVDENELCRQMQVLRRAMMKKVNSLKQADSESTKSNRTFTQKYDEKRKENKKSIFDQINQNKSSSETTGTSSEFSITSLSLPVVLTNPLSNTYSLVSPPHTPRSPRTYTLSSPWNSSSDSKQGKDDKQIYETLTFLEDIYPSEAVVSKRC